MKKHPVEITSAGLADLSWRKRKHRSYQCWEDPDGTIHLVPAVRVPAKPERPRKALSGASAVDDLMEKMRKQLAERLR